MTRLYTFLLERVQLLSARQSSKNSLLFPSLNRVKETETLFTVVFPPNPPQANTQGNIRSLVSVHLVKFDAAVKSDAAF